MILMERLRNSLIDFRRAILILLVVLVHVVHFGDLHPDTKDAILAFMMPAFLVITGYLVNVDKPVRKFLLYLLKIALPYTIMVSGYMLLSMYLPVRDGIESFDIHTLCRVLFVTSIGPYWFFRVMIICGCCYYLVFHLCQSLFDRNTRYMLLASALLAISLFTPVLDVKAAAYYFIGVGIRVYVRDFERICVGSLWSFIPFLVLLSRQECRGWETLYVLACVMCFFSFTTVLAKYPKGKVRGILLYIGKNTLPIYIFHPVFTMLAKFALPMFQFDVTGYLHALFTIAMSVAGSLGIAYVMDKTHISYIFAYRKLLR